MSGAPPRFLVGCSIMLAIACAAAASPSPSPMLTFEPGVLVVTGVTPSGRLVWFGHSREIEQQSLHEVRREGVARDDDGDGVLRLQLATAISPASVWFAVDLTTGRLAMATPGESPFREIAFPEGALRPGATQAVESFLGAHRFLEVLLVRPAAGAWALSVGDGGASDEDGGRDGRVGFSAAQLRPVGDSPALSPAVFRPGDIVLVVDTERLEFFAATLKLG